LNALSMASSWGSDVELVGFNGRRVRDS